MKGYVSALGFLGVLLTQSAALAGNGAPSGAHFQVNIIGVDNPKNTSMDCGDGRRIFVALSGRSTIKLAEGPFAVLDCNGTDSNGAAFQLPNPDLDNNGVTAYSVFARALGKPGGSAKVTTCATDPVTGDEICSLDSLTVSRSKGKQSFTNVSKELLYIEADLDGDGIADANIPLFDSRLQDYLWYYDNNRLKVLQLRFYEIPSNINLAQ